jgi:hypothetical protein
LKSVSTQLQVPSLRLRRKSPWYSRLTSHGTQESTCYVLLLSSGAISNLMDEPPKLPYFVVNNLEIPSSYGLTEHSPEPVLIVGTFYMFDFTISLL